MRESLKILIKIKKIDFFEDNIQYKNLKKI